MSEKERNISVKRNSSETYRNNSEFFFFFLRKTIANFGSHLFNKILISKELIHYMTQKTFDLEPNMFVALMLSEMLLVAGLQKW
jgi:hypothetical protein